MKFYCLSNDPAKPCYVVTFKELTIMLDCGLIMNSALNFFPLSLVQSSKFTNSNNSREESQLDGELKGTRERVFVDSSPEFQPPLDKIIDFSEIDVILISNYINMLALPYITEYSGFKGVVYTTEPTLQIARFFLEELVEYIEASPKPNSAIKWKENPSELPPPLCDAFKPKKWKKIFTIDDVHKSLSRVEIAGYDQKLNIYGALEITPVSSGFCLGSTNWVLSTGLEKISYISGSSTLTTSNLSMNSGALKKSDIIIMSGLTQAPHVNPDGCLGDLCMNVVITIREGGSVLIPCYPSGVIYDLFECLSSHLDNSGLSQIPMFFISPVAEHSLAYSNILAEWLSVSKQNKVYIPDEPFVHANLVKNARLKFFKHIYSEGFSSEFRQPCVVFCGHPSLRFGDIVHLIELWGSNPAHAIIFTEPDFQYHQALAPFQPILMKTLYCPIETSLNFQQANKLIKDLKPNVLVIPENYTQPPPIAPLRTDLVIDKQTVKQIITFKHGDCIKLPLKRKKNQVFIQPEIAQSVVPQEVVSGVKMAPLTGLLQVKDNVHNISQYDESAVEDIKRVPKLLINNLLKSKISYEYGHLDIDLFLKKLQQDGITDIKIEQINETDGILTKIELMNKEMIINITDKGTHMICDGVKQAWRLKVRDLLLACVNKF